MAEGKEGRATELGSDRPSPTRPESPKQGGRGGRSREAARGGAGVVAPDLRPQGPQKVNSAATRGRPSSSAVCAAPNSLGQPDQMPGA